MDENKEFLEEFLDWVRECGEDVFYIFENTEKAINEFMDQRKIVN